MTKYKIEDYYFPIFIVIIAILSYVRIFFLNGVFSDDHHFLMSVYTSNNIQDFLKTSGLMELRRVPQGIILYLMLILFKITDHAFFILHLVTVATQIITPIFLYLLVNKLFKNKLAAFMAGVSLIIYPIDTTIPIVTTLWYRFGLMFSVISFYLTQRALAEKIKWFYLAIALLLSGISHYFLVETTIALEPARLFMIGLIMHKRGLKTKKIVIGSLKFWLPFILLCIPVAVIKLLFKPCGIHAGFYTGDILFFLNWKLHLKYLIMLFGGNWVYSLQKIEYLSFWSVTAGLTALVIAYTALEKIIADKTGFEDIRDFFKPFSNREKSGLMQIDTIVIFGLVILVPVFAMYEIFANTPLGTEYDTRHGCVMQFGHALIIGGLICGIIYKLFSLAKGNNRYVLFFISGVFGLGVFFNNLNLDRYFALWAQEKQFYRSFVQRLPALPKNSTFVFDIEPKMPLKDHVYAFYNAEYYLNMLYTKSQKPEEFREYKVPSLEWFFVDQFKIDADRCSMLTYWGREIYDARKVIVVRWKPGELLVNREIINKYPDIRYKYLADKDIPVIPAPSNYPLRNKVKHFLLGD